MAAWFHRWQDPVAAAFRGSPQAPLPSRCRYIRTPPLWARGAGLPAAGCSCLEYGIHLEPVSGFEPLTCRLQEVWLSAPMRATCADSTARCKDDAVYPGLFCLAVPRHVPCDEPRGVCLEVTSTVPT